MKLFSLNESGEILVSMFSLLESNKSGEDFLLILKCRSLHLEDVLMPLF